MRGFAGLLFIVISLSQLKATNAKDTLKVL